MCRFQMQKNSHKNSSTAMPSRSHGCAWWSSVKWSNGKRDLFWMWLLAQLSFRHRSCLSIPALRFDLSYLAYFILKNWLYSMIIWFIYRRTSLNSVRIWNWNTNRLASGSNAFYLLSWQRKWAESNVHLCRSLRHKLLRGAQWRVGDWKWPQPVTGSINSRWFALFHITILDKWVWIFFFPIRQWIYY